MPLFLRQPRTLFGPIHRAIVNSRPAYLDSLGWVYFRLGRIESAEKNLREAHRREPTDPTIAEHLGDLEMKRGNMAGAIQNWEKALELQTEEPDRVKQKLQKARAPVSQR